MYSVFCAVLNQHVASPLSLPLRTTHAVHPSPANDYNDPTQGSKKTTILSHSPHTHQRQRPDRVKGKAG